MTTDKLKILCIYHDDEVQFLAQDPEEVFCNHEVFTVNTSKGGEEILREDPNHFDIVLADKYMPVGGGTKDWVQTTELMRFTGKKVKGFGLFVPAMDKQCYVGQMNGHITVVADRTCWVEYKKRDWRKLLCLVKRMIDEFSIVYVTDD